MGFKRWEKVAGDIRAEVVSMDTPSTSFMHRTMEYLQSKSCLREFVGVVSSKSNTRMSRSNYSRKLMQMTAEDREIINRLYQKLSYIVHVSPIGDLAS